MVQLATWFLISALTFYFRKIKNNLFFFLTEDPITKYTCAKKKIHFRTLPIKKKGNTKQRTWTFNMRIRVQFHIMIINKNNYIYIYNLICTYGCSFLLTTSWCSKQSKPFYLISQIQTKLITVWLTQDCRWYQIFWRFGGGGTCAHSCIRCITTAPLKQNLQKKKKKYEQVIQQKKRFYGITLHWHSLAYRALLSWRTRCSLNK